MKDSDDQENVQTRRVIRTINHASYDDWSLEADIALLELDSPITMYDSLSEFDTPSGFESVAGELVTVSGWGTIEEGGYSSDVALTVKVPIVLNSVCDSLSAYYGQIMDGMMCAGAEGLDSCQGDSGGPLFKERGPGDFVLTGVVSWGAGCGGAGAPGVYTRASYYKDWICERATTSAMCGPQPPRPPSPPPRPPSPPPSPRPAGTCTNSCSWANDGDCDDGGDGSDGSCLGPSNLEV